MIKRIFDILTFPFYLIYLFLSFPFKIVKIINNGKIEKRKREGNITKRKTSQDELLEIGKYLFPDFYNEYATFINSYLKDEKTFIAEKEYLLSNYDNFELDKLKPLEAIYIFGDSRQKLHLTDWRGEENTEEIESFLKEKLQITTDWKNVNKLRERADKEKQRDENFIIDLLKTIDKDLKLLNKRMVFFDLGWDAYVYTVIDHTSYRLITNRFGALFHGTEKL